jgi:hypothetical protein
MHEDQLPINLKLKDKNEKKSIKKITNKDLSQLD